MAKTPPLWLQEILGSDDPESGLRARIAAAIDAARPAGARWSSGRPLNLLLLGYSGAGNVGADIRVLETIRQLRSLFGGDLGLRVSVIGSHIPADGFHGVAPIALSSDLAGFLAEAGDAYDGVLVTEGSLFTSTFSDTLAAALAGGLGLFSARGKLSVGYGSEAGAMSPAVAAFVSRYCRDSLVLCRNEESYAALDALGMRVAPGADTAWTFAPADAEAGRTWLRAHGWDGRAPILAVCPVNPFWWPVRPDPIRFRAMQERGEFRDLHYSSFFFHQSSEDSRRRYQAYVAGLADAIRVFSREQPAFPVLVGMEPLDRRACGDVAARLDAAPPIVCSGEATADAIVGTLREAAIVVSSRFHAIVTSMGGRPVPIGVSMDARIVNLMHKLGRPDLVMRADAPDLGEQVLMRMRAALGDADAIRPRIERLVAGEVLALGRMGRALAVEVERVYPGATPRATALDGLPPLAQPLRRLLEQHT